MADSIEVMANQITCLAELARDLYNAEDAAKRDAVLASIEMMAEQISEENGGIRDE